MTNSKGGKKRGTFKLNGGRASSYCSYSVREHWLTREDMNGFKRSEEVRNSRIKRGERRVGESLMDLMAHGIRFN